MVTYLSSKSIGPFAVQSNDLSRRLIALGLVIALVGLAALLYPATVPHLMHHAQHHTGTHGTIFCSWLCAAGQVADHAALNLPFVSLAPERVVYLQECAYPSLLAVEGSSRSPPSIPSV